MIQVSQLDPFLLASFKLKTFYCSKCVCSLANDPVSYPMISMPSLFSLCSVFSCMFVWLGGQDFESSATKEFQKENDLLI